MKKNVLSVLSVLFGILYAQTVAAFCPVCTIAVGAGVGLSRWLGIDDTISGLWVGGLMISMTMWTIDWLKRKKYNFKYKEVVTAIIFYALLIIPLYYQKIVGHPYNELWGIDKLILGIILGSISFYAGGKWYQSLKAKNNNQAYFPFQKVVMPIASLIILSVVFYFITK